MIVRLQVATTTCVAATAISRSAIAAGLRAGTDMTPPVPGINRTYLSRVCGLMRPAGPAFPQVDIWWLETVETGPVGIEALTTYYTREQTAGLRAL